MATKSQLISGLTLPLPHPPSTSSSSNNNNSNNNNTLSLVKRRNLTTSFFNGGVEALKVTRIRTGLCTRSHCYGQGGGALGTRMNLFDRFARVVKSYANAIISSFEDPEKILEQTVLEMNDDLTKMRQATAQVLASQKRLENKYKAAQQASEEWYRKAQLALQKGEEDLAREALKRRKTYADNANSFKAQLDQQRGVVENLISNTRLLESKIQEAKSKKDTLKARAQSAKLTATKVNEMLGNVNTSNALSAFEKMEEKGKYPLYHFSVSSTNMADQNILAVFLPHHLKVALSSFSKASDCAYSGLTSAHLTSGSLVYCPGLLHILAMESEAEALGQLTTNELDGKFALLEGSSVDDDLENLKNELAGSSKKGELPPGRTVVTNSNNPFRDPDIEMELNELRQKRNNF
ncbi:hypothetical protein DKX38_009682 [Salix brachista]|uniref:Membrane-associated 30 kDa protein, chloroplastic n=1 Tax=Salix brachista TaxID=2182728 RepID=A0A5N5MDS5_9ROSI|nr:hypothetical protein DKX38_009682 [Salix brachista]